jgi:uncharacterized protein (DUF1501 family)
MAGSRLSYTAFASPEDEPNQAILVVVFLRGGCDGLNFVVPKAGPDRAHYEAQRQNLIIPDNQLLTLGTMTGINGAGNVELGLNPSAGGLHNLFTNGSLAVIHAAGLDYDSRSHFDMMDYIERGTPGDKGTVNGWLTRHLQTAPDLPSEIIAPALAVNDLPPDSLLGSQEAITASSFSSFQLNTGSGRWRDAQRMAMRHLYNGDSWLYEAGVQALDAVDIIESQALSDYIPANGAIYPTNGFGDDLKMVAQMIKQQLGMRIATIDLGGWDTHEYQGDGGGGNFGTNLVGTLSSGLEAFYTDLNGAGSDNYMQRTTVVVMTEFGRKLIMNASRGTDHGHGSIMLVLGGPVNGGIYGGWPGLSNEQLYDGRDLAITTDYRRVLSEILIRRLQNPKIGQVFPGYTGYEPMDIVQGEDLDVAYDSKLYLPMLIR